MVTPQDTSPETRRARTSTGKLSVSRLRVWEALAEVADPEIPAVSIIDLGIVKDVHVDEDRVEVTCLPTFVGCPALEIIQEDIESAVRKIGGVPDVRFVHQPPWSTERITDEGRRKLRDYGLAPPHSGDPMPESGSLAESSGPSSFSVRVTLLSPGECPYCGSRDTVMENPFGPTLCRATCYCRSCRNPFEKFKRV